MMHRSLLVSTTRYETRAALLEDGVVVELPLERTRNRSVAGNIYKGRVRRVLPGMQSAFVDIGLDKDAFLYVADVVSDEGRDCDRPGCGDSATGSDGDETVERPPIEERLREGEEVIVQAVKDPMAGKGARITTHVTLPGRHLVYMPTVDHIGVSRRIEDAEERARLRKIIELVRGDGTGGFIVRTAAVSLAEDEFEADARFLIDQWKELSERTEPLAAPTLVHRELVLVDKLLRDLVAGDFGEIVVDTEAVFERCVEFLSRVQPELVDRVKLHGLAEPLFDVYGIESEIHRALRSRVWLKSGGYIVINQTEALVAIDVNTGRYVGTSNLENTALKTNLEAVSELVRQVRLRDLGGIIVVDFIDMGEPGNREAVVGALEEELRRDRSKTKILQISDFGLVEMTRKRVKGSLERLLSRPCDCCAGTGRVKTPATLCYEIHRELLKARRRVTAGTTIELRVHPEVAEALGSVERDVVDDLERELSARVVVRPDAGVHVEHFDYMLP